MQGGYGMNGGQNFCPTCGCGAGMGQGWTGYAPGYGYGFGPGYGTVVGDSVA